MYSVLKLQVKDVLDMEGTKGISLMVLQLTQRKQ